MIQNVLIVCMGNVCRSPMAEGLLRHELKAFPAVTVHSAGITALVDKPAETYAQEVMLEKKGVDIRAHRARQLTLDLLHQTELVLVMDQSQQKKIEFKYPTIYGRVHRLGKWSGFDIVDPYQRSKQVFEQTLALIDESIKEWRPRLWK